jgi:TolB-like protein
MGDYETILVRYKLPQLSGTGSRQLARFTVNAKNILGKQLAPLTQTINISLSGESVDGIATGKLLYSGTMMHFAETLKEIGYLYYDGRDGDNSLIRLFECHGKTVAIKAELENAKLRLDDDEVFKKQLEILNNYDELFRRMIAEERGEAPQPRIIPVPEENKIPDNMVVLQNRVGSLFREIALSFPEGGNTVVAISSFVLRDGSEPPLIGYLNQSAVTALAGTPRLRLVERDRIDLVLKEQGYHAQTLVDADAAIRLGNLLGARYIITGQIIPMSTQVIVFGRVINVETGEIVSAAQIFLDRNILGDLI